MIESHKTPSMKLFFSENDSIERLLKIADYSLKNYAYDQPEDPSDCIKMHAIKAVRLG